MEIKFDENGWFIQPKFGILQEDVTYNKGHRKRPAFKFAQNLANSWANCTSIIDVGCHAAGFLSDMKDTYVNKTAIDIYKPAFLGFDEKKVNFIHDDFLTTEVGNFDVVICLECLEHIYPKNRITFANKLIATANKHLIISIPYMWGKTPEPIPHEGLNETHVNEWFYPIIPNESWKLGAHYVAHYDINNLQKKENK